MAVSLDGVMLGIEDPKADGMAKTAVSTTSRERTTAVEKKDEPEVKVPSRPPADRAKRMPAIDEENRNPSHEASCGTIALYDREGEPLSVIRLARMPEEGKKTLGSMMLAKAILSVRPDLIVESLADRVKDNWKLLSKEPPRIVPRGTAITKTLDLFHGAEHLEEALAAYYGESSKKQSAQFEKLRHTLRHEEDGNASVIRSLRNLAEEKPQTKVLEHELKCFRKNRKRKKIR